MQCGRQMILSISPGETPVNESNHVKKYANMWRMADDFWDNWEQLLHMFQYARSWQGVGGAGGLARLRYASDRKNFLNADR